MIYSVWCVVYECGIHVHLYVCMYGVLCVVVYVYVMYAGCFYGMCIWYGVCVYMRYI